LFEEPSIPKGSASEPSHGIGLYTLPTSEDEKLIATNAGMSDWISQAPATHSLCPHSEVKARSAHGIPVIEFNACLVEPDLQHAGLKGDFYSPSYEHQ